jgi:hypothetical protein
MYQKTTNASELSCDLCNMKIPLGTVYFDDSVYNSLYAKVEIQKSLCFDCGETYWRHREEEYLKYETSQRRPRIRRFIITIVTFTLIMILLNHLYFK